MWSIAATFPSFRRKAGIHHCRNVFTRDNRYVGKPPILMVRTNEWKFNYLSWDRSELFDMRKDPGEFQKVVNESRNANVVKELRTIAERIYTT